MKETNFDKFQEQFHEKPTYPTHLQELWLSLGGYNYHTAVITDGWNSTETQQK